jgi:DNA polymerase I-like protein with 3'-5' exonuclease and polymerase domains
VALGALSYRGNAEEWGGRNLIYRGWPDDWLTNRDWMIPRRYPGDKNWLKLWEKHGYTPDQLPLWTGHPLFGKYVPSRTLLCPVQVLRIILSRQNDELLKQWIQQVRQAIAMAAKPEPPLPNFHLPHYNLVDSPEPVEDALRFLIEHPGTRLSYDTETTGLLPFFEDEAIVLMMMRWETEQGPQSIGFPWDYPESPLKPHLERLTPLVLEALASSSLVGHNLSFDVLYSVGTLDPQRRWLDAIADAMCFDTMHMRYTYQYLGRSLGLDAIAYTYVKELAGYDEDFSLLIDLHSETMNPQGKSWSLTPVQVPPAHSTRSPEAMTAPKAHYANCPKEQWKSHLEPYIMGDVEVTWRARDRLAQRLQDAEEYRIPIADPKRQEFFRSLRVPRRDWVYERIMVPASRVLTKMMGRGLFVNTDTLANLEETFPSLIQQARQEVAKFPKVAEYIEEREKEDPEFEFDLESRDQLKTILFDRLGLPVSRVTKSGQAAALKLGVPWEKWSDEQKYDYAAVDKFTLNAIVAKHPDFKPLQDYKKLLKLWSTYIRPLRNVRGHYHDYVVDKKERKQPPHLCPDSCIHCTFNLTGTRGGRLSSRNPNMQQLPRRGLQSAETNVKTLYSSRFGDDGIIYQADLSQIELRLMAAISGDPAMVSAYWNNVDLHTQTASRIFNRPYEHFSKEYMEWLQKKDKKAEAKQLSEMRSIGKTTNFLTGYGGGAFGLMTTLANNGIYRELDVCQSIIDAFFGAYPTLRQFLQIYKRFILNFSAAVSVFGRVRILLDAESDDGEIQSKALRAGCNHIIQSTASDMMLMALVAVEELMRKENMSSILVSTVHDSLVIDGLKEEAQAVHELVMAVLNNFEIVLPRLLGEDYDTSWMTVPFAGDAEIGPNYGDLTAISDESDWDKLLAA